MEGCIENRLRVHEEKLTDSNLKCIDLMTGLQMGEIRAGLLVLCCLCLVGRSLVSLTPPIRLPLPCPSSSKKFIISTSSSAATFALPRPPSATESIVGAVQVLHVEVFGVTPHLMRVTERERERERERDYT
jgi:hypothetical protein